MEKKKRKTRTALIVEDDPELQEEVRAQLARMGFEAVGALHYDAAVEHLASVVVDLAVVDLELPTESGYELCELIRETPDFAKIPILVTSDSSDPEHMAFAERAGANAFLRKPFSMKELARYIDALVRNSRRSEPRLHRLRP